MPLTCDSATRLRRLSARCSRQICTPAKHATTTVATATTTVEIIVTTDGISIVRLYSSSRYDFFGSWPRALPTKCLARSLLGTNPLLKSFDHPLVQ